MRSAVAELLPVVAGVAVGVALLPSGLASASPPAEPTPLRVVAPTPVSAFDVDLLSIFGKLHGRTVVAAEAIPGGPLAAVAAGSADVAVGVSGDGGDMGDLAVTTEVLPTRLVAVTRRPAPRATSIEALRHTRIGTARGSRARAALQAAKVSSAELVEYGSADLAAVGLRDGAVMVLLVELPDAFTARRADPELEFGTFIGLKASLVYGVAARDRGVADELDRFLQSIRRTPSWGALLTRRFGPEAVEVLGQAWK